MYFEQWDNTNTAVYNWDEGKFKYERSNTLKISYEVHIDIVPLIETSFFFY